MNALSHAPELAYRNAPPAPYKGMQLQCVHTPQATRKHTKLLKSEDVCRIDVNAINNDFSSLAEVASIALAIEMNGVASIALAIEMNKSSVILSRS